MPQGPGQGRKADLSVYTTGRRLPPRRGPLREPPDLLVEVVTPTPRDTRRDRLEKLDEYARFGARHYWIVDPAIRSLEIFELRGRGVRARYVRVLGASEGTVTDVPGCEGLRLDLDALWAEQARLPDPPSRPVIRRRRSR